MTPTSSLVVKVQGCGETCELQPPHSRAMCMYVVNIHGVICQELLRTGETYLACMGCLSPHLISFLETSERMR